MIRQATAALILAVVATVAPAAAPATAVAMAPGGLPGFCPSADGVTVVVDFNELGGGVVVRCAEGAQKNGLAALENAGFTVAGTQRWQKAFICRIEGKPGADTEPCLNTPPASAYWSYWHAPNGGPWDYSDFGVLNRVPPAGSFDGWSFAKDKAASAVPPPGIAPRRPVSPVKPTTKTPPPPPPGQVTQPPNTVAPSADSPTAGPSAEALTSATPQGSTSATPADQGWSGDLAEPPANTGNNPAGVIAAAAVLMVLLAAALWIKRKRKAAVT
jgi:LPXTG-motif cell wall-anchored protein